MQQKYLYEYSVVRIVPVVEREEFVNAGVILFCKGEKYLKVMFRLPHEVILALSPGTDVDEIRKNLEAFSMIASGKKEGGPIACLDVASAFDGSPQYEVHPFKRPGLTRVFVMTLKTQSINYSGKWLDDCPYPKKLNTLFRKSKILSH